MRVVSPSAPVSKPTLPPPFPSVYTLPDRDRDGLDVINYVCCLTANLRVCSWLCLFTLGVTFYSECRSNRVFD